MQAFFDRAPAAIWRKLALAWLGMLVVAVLYAVHLYQERQVELQKTQQQAVLRSIQLANALTQQTQVLLRNLDFIVQHLSEHWKNQGTADFRRVISLAQSTLPKDALVQIAIADARGDVVFSNLTPPGRSVPAVSIADRAHFQAHLHADHPQLYISEPVWGRVSGQWVLQFSYPIRSEGVLSSVLVASVSVEYLTEAFRQVLPDAQDVVALVNDGGRYLARSHSLKQAMGTGVPAELIFLKDLPQQNGVYETATQVDGVVRYYAWQHIPGYPVLLHLGLGKEKVLAPVLAELHDSYTINAAVWGLLLAAALWISYLTVLKVAQNQQLADTQERLHQTVQAAQVGLWFWNIDSGEMQWDPYCQEIAGHGRSGLPCQYGDWCALLHPHDRPRVETCLQQIESVDGQFLALECRLQGADGLYRWIELRGRITPPSQAAQDKARHFMGTCTDIGARVAANQLRRALLDQSTAAIFLVNAQRCIVQASTRAEQLFAPQGSSVVGQHAAMLHLDEAHAQAMAARYQELRQEGVARMVHPLKDATGAIRWFDMHANLCDPDDPESPAVWTMIDVTEGHVAKKNLEIESSRLTTLLERFPAGVLLEDADCRIVMANGNFCALLQLSQEPEALKGLGHATLLEQLGSERAAWLPLPANRLEKRRTSQISVGEERFLEIDWVPIVRAELPLGHVWLVRDVTERKQKERQLAVLASTDTLTSLPNRRSLMAMLAQRLQSPGHGAPHGALLMLDIDHFKQVNDTYGHPVGDLVLQQMAQVMRQSLRADDYAARLGGEEFVVLLHQTTLQESRQLAERLRECVASHPADAGAVGMIAITVSIGLVELTDGEGAVALARADKALYAAKAAGRNRVCVAAPG